MWCSENWKDYELLDASDGERLERWGKYILVRPDPQVIWKGAASHKAWKQAHAVYRRSSNGGGGWVKNTLPAQWNIGYGDLSFVLRPMGFKHTGLFPEQAANWDWFSELIRKSGRKTVRVLNLFAYTGAASVACSSAGALVTHIDASKGMVERAKENAKINGITNIRFIVDDCVKFIEREIRRGNTYDAIIMDPPSYGRGPSGEMWRLEDNLADFVELTKKVLSDKPLFVLINSYTTGLQPTVIANILKSVFGHANVEADEIGLPTEEGLVLPCGATGVKIWIN